MRYIVEVLNTSLFAGRRCFFIKRLGCGLLVVLLIVSLSVPAYADARANQIYESGYRYAAYDFKTWNSTSGTLNYIWSPDINGTYTSAT